MIVFFQLLLPLCSKFLCMSLFIRCMSLFKNTSMQTITSKNTEISLLYRNQQIMKTEPKNDSRKLGKGSSLNCHRAFDFRLLGHGTNGVPIVYHYFMVCFILLYTDCIPAGGKRTQIILDKKRIN